MYSSFQLGKKYLNYYIKAKNSKGHGVHSPFVFDFIIHVLDDTKEYEYYKEIESLRKKLLKNDSTISIEDFGAGSAVIPFKSRKVSAIAKSSLKNKKFASLLYRVVKYYQPKSIVELGTSFGITTCYMASGNKNADIITFEGSKEIARIAKQNFAAANLKNIDLVEGNFNETFFEVLSKMDKIDFAFIDGNHRREATVDYFLCLSKKSTNTSIFIFDDIHWSSEMEEAWKQIQEHEAVTLTIDLFFIGIVFFNSDFKVKQHFTIRF
jgi:predicted O-methyltransferase YrrM